MKNNEMEWSKEDWHMYSKAYKEGYLVASVVFILLIVICFSVLLL